MLGCTNPLAKNYNPEADVDDGSCIYLVKAAGQCHAFKDVNPELVNDKSFTLSFSLQNTDWVFFHDYYPDFYFRSRNQLFNLKNKKIYRHHEGPYGRYHDNVIKPFLVDALFNDDQEMILNSIQWISEVLRSDGVEREFQTFSHITIWNNQQCSGRLSIDDIFNQMHYDARKTQGAWSFEDFRDQVRAQGISFIRDLFNNFAVDPAGMNFEKPWYSQDLLHDTWFIVRFEFDNVSGDQFIFHEAQINTSKSYR